MFRRTLILLAVAALTLVAPASIHAWQWVDAALKPVPMPTSAQPAVVLVQADFDGDGLPETLALSADGRASIQSGSRRRWQSPPQWRVRQALVADLNHDGQPEAVLLVWRPFQPWPVDAWLPSDGRINSFHDARGMSCQIILIGWYQNEFRERWAGSALAEPVIRLAAADLDGDGKQLLVTLESEYNDPASAPARRLKIWDWNGFGFSVVYKMEGPFSQMQVVHAPYGPILILLP